MESSPHPLDGCWAKLRWAKVNLDALRSEVTAFFGDESDPDSPRGHLESKARGGLPDRQFDPPWHWALMVGDIAHAFRAALDYLAWELAVLNLRREGKARKPNRRTAFPIVRDPADWKDVSAPRLADIGQQERTLIEKCQPYNTGITEGAAQHGLLWLTDLVNRDKHQSLRLVLVRAGGVEDGLAEIITDWALITSSYREHMTIHHPTGEQKGEMYMKASFHIALEGAARIDWILDAIGPQVTKIVRAFEPVFEDA